MARSKICSVSVDLDPLTAYYAIHGLGDPPRPLRFTILRKALPRFEELFAEAGVRATFFVIGRDLEEPEHEEAREVLRRLVASGHEIANHTCSHPYDLCRLPEQVIEAEIRRCHELCVEILGREATPVGFRAPGYTIDGAVHRVLASHGYRYDSSMFPSPPYWVAKLGVMAMMSLRGRSSASVVSDPRALFSPADPYRPDPDRPWRRGQSPLVELPVAVQPFTRLPAIGTLLAVAPEALRRFVLASMARRPFFNLELHGIDLTDAIADRIPTQLAGRQPDLRVPFDEKRRRFLQTFEDLRRGGYEMLTLAETAALVQREGEL
jgi:peptidoglycan/xylan/chitin deacetylase (PgdA/CDA1 family)